MSGAAGASIPHESTEGSAQLRSQPQGGSGGNDIGEREAQDIERSPPGTPSGVEPRAPVAEVPVHTQVQQILQRVAEKGRYSLMSVVHGRTMDGFIRFDGAPGWLEANMQRLFQSKAIIVALDIENRADQEDLRRVVSLLKESPRLVRHPIFAVPLTIDNSNLMEDHRQEVEDVFASRVDDFFPQVDDGIYASIEVALLRIARLPHALNDLQRELNELDEELNETRNQLDYLHWQWIPSQLSLADIPSIDTTLEERPDGSVGDLQFMRRLGKGAFGMVHQARAPSGQHLAIKVMRKDNAPTVQAVERIYREIQILATLPPHQHLARLQFVLHSIDTIYLCLAYGGPINLYNLQRQQQNRVFALDTAQRIFGQIAGAVGHMHQHVVFHRDIKPENIAVDNTQDNGYHTMLVDYGLSVSSERPLRQMCGSLPFAAPEILEEPRRYFGGPVDAFALGMLLFELVRGQSTMANELGWPRGTEPSPLRGQQLRTLLSNGPPNANRDTNEPREVGQLCSRLLRTDPAQRANVAEVLRSPWVTNTAAAITLRTPAAQQQ